MNLVVGEQAIDLDFPRILHLATQGQNRLCFAVPRHLGRTAGRIALDEEQLVFGNARRFAVRELARQHRHARLLFLFHLLGILLARQRLPDRQFGNCLSCVHMLVEPDFEGIAHHAGNQFHRLARIELLLDLALELRIENARRKYVAHARAGILLLQLHATRQQRMVFDEGFQRLEDPGAQARFVGAAGDGRNQVDIRLMGNVRRAIGPPAQRPGRAFALGKTFVLAAGVVFCSVNGRRRSRFVAVLAGQFAEITAEAFRVAPCFRQLAAVGLFDIERHLHAGQQHGLGTQQVFEFRLRHPGRVEILRVGNHPHPRAGLPAASAKGFQRRHLLAAFGKRHRMDLAFAPHFHFDTEGQRIGHRDADAVQAAGKRIGGIAGLLVELAAGVQAHEGEHDDRNLFLRMQADRDAAPVVRHRDGTAPLYRHMQVLGKAGQRLVGGVVDDFLDDVGGRVGAGVHPGPLAHGFQSLQDAEG